VQNNESSLQDFCTSCLQSCSHCQSIRMESKLPLKCGQFLGQDGALVFRHSNKKSQPLHLVSHAQQRKNSQGNGIPGLVQREKSSFPSDLPDSSPEPTVRFSSTLCGQRSRGVSASCKGLQLPLACRSTKWGTWDPFPEQLWGKGKSDVK